MIQAISVNPPEKIQRYTELIISDEPLEGFPLLSIDRDSYIVRAEVQSGIDFRPRWAALLSHRQGVFIGGWNHLYDRPEP